jgi:uncharacterized protein
VVVYLDSSAIVKIVVREAESADSRRLLGSQPIRAVSALSRVEVVRTVRSHGEDAVARAGEVLHGLVQIAVDDAVLDRAAGLDTALLRSLDAIHVATALTLAAHLQVVVTYDDRMRTAALANGLRVAAPGATE